MESELALAAGLVKEWATFLVTVTAAVALPVICVRWGIKFRSELVESIEAEVRVKLKAELTEFLKTETENRMKDLDAADEALQVQIDALLRSRDSEQMAALIREGPK